MVKSYRKRLIIFAICFFLFDYCFGQQFSNIKKCKIVIDTLLVDESLPVIFFIDSLPIVPESFLIMGIKEDCYHVDYISAALYIDKVVTAGTEISCIYRTLPMKLLENKYHRKPLQLPASPVYVPQIIPLNQYNFVFKDDAELKSDGFLSRGFIMGSNQDFVFNSMLNLRLSGMLADSLEIVANISDQSIPIQPNGNTQVIQDFDKIFIHLNYKNSYKLQAGDIDLTGSKSYFMKTNKQLLGMSFISDQTLGKTHILTNEVGGGINKGKYRSYFLTIINGVQGPYRLYGENNEQQLIILSGSEKVYLDGKQLQRGEENDYVMDYNTGEITFTTNILVVSEKRFFIEFEYKDTYYANYTIFSMNEWCHEKNNKLKLGLKFIHQQDIKNRSIQPELTDEMKWFLSGLGSNSNEAYFPNIDTAQFKGNEVLYKKIDTVINGKNYTVYRYCTNNDITLYRLGFTLMGTGKGNYILSTSIANGRVFEWVAPIDGISQGNYEPVLKLLTPKMRDLATLEIAYAFSKKISALAEFAFSNYDKNIFSKKDDNNNLGFAIKFRLAHQDTIKNKKNQNNNWQIKSNIDYEFVQKNFNTEERFRDIEFARNYNLPTAQDSRFSTNMLTFKTLFYNPNIGEKSLDVNWFSRAKDLFAIRNQITSKTDINGYKFGTTTSFLFSIDSAQTTNFLASTNHFSKEFKKVVIGAGDNFELNLFKKSENKKLELNSYAFNQVEAFIANSGFLNFSFKLSAMNRVEYVPKAILYRLNDENNLIINAMHNEIQTSAALNKYKNNQLKVTAIYRNTIYEDSLIKKQQEHFFTGNIEYFGKFCKNSIILSTFYELGSGMEQKREFSFIKVANGQGTHVWRDFNNNGIEELNEFELAVFQDEANYLKIFINTSEYIMTFNNKFTQTLQLRPSTVWKDKKGFRKFLSLLENITTFSAVQKSNNSKDIQIINPFRFDTEDSTLIRSTLSFINTLSFNKLNKYWGVDFVVHENRNKDLLFYGFEAVKFSDQSLIARINPISSITLRSNYTHSIKHNISEYMINRNFEITTYQIDNTIQWQYNMNFFTDVNYVYKKKLANFGLYMKNFMQTHQLSLNFNYRMPGKGNIVSNVQYVHIKSDLKTNSTLQYEMLEGLKDGNNVIWMVSYQTLITSYLQINLSYNGRYSEGNKVINTGNIQLKALF